MYSKTPEGITWGKENGLEEIHKKKTIDIRAIQYGKSNHGGYFSSMLRVICCCRIC